MSQFIISVVESFHFQCSFVGQWAKTWFLKLWLTTFPVGTLRVIIGFLKIVYNISK
jgi:hypothetical protein